MFDKTPISKALGLIFGSTISSALLFAASAYGQAADTASQKLEKIEVTGSSIKRIEGETALPVQVLGKEEIQRSGASTTEQLLKMVSATASTGSTSVANTAAGGGQGGAGSVSAISLRGLGSARTLVLVNGRRAAPVGGSTAIDISTIPVSAIDRIEVLKDGASAIYGSDAVAGVVNFILRRDFAGAEVTGTFGTPTRDGGGDEAKVAAFAGFGNLGTDRYNVNVGASYQTVKPIFGSDRSFAKNINVGELLDKTSNTAFPANVRLNNGNLISPNYPNCGPFSIVSPLLPGLCRYDNAPYVSLQPDSKQANVILNGRINISASAEAYVESSFTRNKTLNTIQHVLINGAAQPAGHPYIASLTNLLNTQYAAFPQLRSLIGSAWALLPPSSPHYPTAFANANGLTGQPLVLLFRSIPNGVRMTEDTTDNSRVVAGLKGTAMGWDYDSGFLFSQNKLTTDLKQGWTLTDKYLNLVNTGVINPFGPTTDPAALAAAMAANYNGNLLINKTSISSFDGKASRELYQLPAGMISLAVGGELRKEKMDLNPSTANRNFEISGFGAPGVPVNASRNVESAFAEVNVPIHKNFDVNAAVRYDNYQRVGSSVNPKVSIRFQPIEMLLVRASYGTGFRAPTLLDLYQPEARGITTNGQRDRIRCPVVVATIQDCSNQFVTIGGGNPLLKPEKSSSKTLGVLIEPNKDISIGIDAFIINLKDVIRTGVPVATILGDPVTYASYIRRGPPDGNAGGVGPILGIEQALTNLGRTNVEGVDIDVKVRVLNIDGNKVTVRANGTYLSKHESQNLDGTYTPAINRPSALNIGVILRWRHTANINYERGPWSASLAQNFQVGYDDLRTSLQAATVTPRHVSTYETYDMQGSYLGFKSTRLTLGIKNVLDRNPPYTNYGGGFVGSYDLSYTDIRGRFVYGTVAYTFK